MARRERERVVTTGGEPADPPVVGDHAEQDAPQQDAPLSGPDREVQPTADMATDLPASDVAHGEPLASVVEVAPAPTGTTIRCRVVGNVSACGVSAEGHRREHWTHGDVGSFPAYVIDSAPSAFSSVD